MNDKFWTIYPREILYLDDKKIIFKSIEGETYIGTTWSIEGKTSGPYTDEEVIFRCNKLVLQGRTY